MDLVYYLPSSVPQNLITWISESSCYPIDDLSIDFLRHLLTYRQAVNDRVDVAIILAPEMILPRNFDDLYDGLNDYFDYDVVLLSNYITNWEGIERQEYIDFDEEEFPDLSGLHNSLCTVNENVKGYFAYWITRGWMERCLHLFDRPWKYFPDRLRLSPKLLITTPSSCFLEIPICYRTDDEFYRRYFSYYYPSIIAGDQKTVDEK